jgi:hypothetical protein
VLEAGRQILRLSLVLRAQFGQLSLEIRVLRLQALGFGSRHGRILA